MKATLTRVKDTVGAAEKLLASLKQMQMAYAKAIFRLASDPDVAENPDKYSKRDMAKKIVIEEAERAGLNESQIREILDTEKEGVQMNMRQPYFTIPINI